MYKKVLLTVLLLLVVLTIGLQAGVSAYAFGDFYYMKYQDAKFKDQNGFWLRRIYFTYDRDISGKFKARFRLEVNSDGKLSAVDTLKTFVKDAYLSYQFLPLHSLTLGIQESLAFGNTEKFWGYRHVEKSVLDLFKTRDSRDFGLTLKGSFDAGKKFSYAVMFGNNSSYRWETNKQKAVYGRLTFNPTANLTFELYADYLGVSYDPATKVRKNSMLLQAFAGVQGSWGRVGLNYMRENISETNKDDVNTNIISALAVAKLASVLEAFARYDMILDPTPWAQDSYIPMSKGYETNVLIAGLGWNIHPKVQISPNIKIVSYGQDKNGVDGPKSDSIYSLTFYYQF